VQIVGSSNVGVLAEAVFAAYSRKSDFRDEEVLEKLLAVNLERVKGK
jgi:hypothetical protein